MASRKVMLLGEIAVGKTSLVRRLVHRQFEHDYKATVGVDLYEYRVEGLGSSGDGVINLIIWDTDGDFGDSIFSHVYCRGASGAMIIADASRAETWASLGFLLQGFETRFPGRPVELLMNKIDLFGDNSMPAFAGELGALASRLRTTSAKNGDNVEASFVALAGQIARRHV